MNTPTDYPVNTEQQQTTTHSSSTDITYAELKNRVDAKQPITDEMIRIAREKLETAYIKPSESKQSKFKLGSIRGRFQTE